ncbi:MAG: MoaD/ThiS family protein [Gemmatimonadota bacterium]
MTEARIRVRVRLFGIFRELAGAEEREVSLAPRSTVQELVGRLRQEAGWEFLPPSPAVAVNREYAASERRLAGGDEVALIPPVAGG